MISLSLCETDLVQLQEIKVNYFQFLANLLHVETASMEEPLSLGEADVITA